MLVVISPAKTLDLESEAPTSTSTKPAFIKEAGQLMEQLKLQSPDELSALMGISQKLGELNYGRNQNWSTPFNRNNSKQSIFTFHGDVYAGFEAGKLTEKQLDFAQERLRILSGLYGLLRPLDLMQPYRLEMGTKFSTNAADNLYQFWGDKLAHALNRQADSVKTDTLINLASNEYFNSIPDNALKLKVITPVFKDFKNGRYKIISFFAKKARGRMAAYIMKKGLKQPSALKRYTEDGYRFDADSSTAQEWIFLRDPE